nr:transglycosylase domain-containing protein [Chloroflexota bacterium]
MSQGRIARASRRYPDARRRAARYGQSRLGQRATGVPPHLLPGVTGRLTAKGGNVARLLLLAGSVMLATLLLLVIAVTISAAAGVAGTLAAYRQVNADLPNAAAVAVNTFQTTRIYDRNGLLLQEVDNPNSGWRSFVPLNQVSQEMIDATVAAEDATFWTNQGVEPLAIARGAAINLSGSGSSGGSTITQQLVRSLFPDQIGFDISYTRKGKEALAAWALNRRYSKTDILTMYLSQIYYGNRSYGIEAAAQTFFNKHASDLTLAEASLLAGLPQAPTFYNPALPENFERAKGRQEYVLDQMVLHRYITRAEALAAFDQPLQ